MSEELGISGVAVQGKVYTIYRKDQDGKSGGCLGTLFAPSPEEAVKIAGKTWEYLKKTGFTAWHGGKKQG